MSISETIRNRRSIGKVKPDPISRTHVEQILEAGIWAPNHRLTEPWKFFVLEGDGRYKLGDALANVARAEGADEDKAASARSKVERAPVIIAVAVEPVDNSKVIELEEYGAVFAAIQNMLLEIHELGLGAVWRSGEPCYHAEMNKAFGLSEKGKMLGFIYLGVPERTDQTSKRTPFAEKTEWITAYPTTSN